VQGKCNNNFAGTTFWLFFAPGTMPGKDQQVFTSVPLTWLKGRSKKARSAWTARVFRGRTATVTGIILRCIHTGQQKYRSF